MNRGVETTFGANFDEWAAQNQQPLVSYAYLVCRDREEARDITQDVLLAVHRQWQHLARQGDPLAYARRSITNACIDRWRRHGRHLAPLPPSGERPQDGDEPGRTTDALLAWQLCGELPPHQRAVVVLRYWADLPHREIAMVLGMPEATVRSHLHRALAAMQPRLTREDLKS